ncbi:Zinc finger CCCH domain-containing protein 19 [Dichanthelium oligosanthes]|uniref:Zinc finger CCCH domain-containing protein 19 n=1 Tax=Dichanthelium oligosanthes TaxID=888268 RepID=A0A1E5W361_9POAL|nr:Zinc finger CCCH domain-containing protein 19 [Dichanthelium oligosanthes]
MTDAEPPPAVEVEEAMPTTPDTALDCAGYKDVEAIEGEKDGGAPNGEGGKMEEGSKPHGDDVVGDELLGIAEDPNLPDVAKADEAEEDAVAEVQTNDDAAAVDVLAEVGAAVASSTSVDAPTEAGMPTIKVTAVDDLTEVGAALVSSTSMDDPRQVGASLVNDDCNIVSSGGVHGSDDQTDKEVGGDSLDADEAAPLVNDVQDDSARMDKDVAVSDDVVPAQDHERPQMDVATALLNEVETEIGKAEDHVAEEGTNMDMQVQTGDDNEAEGVGTISDAATDEEGKHMGAVTTTRDDSKKHNGAVGVDASDEGIQMDRDELTGDDNEQKETVTADEDHVEEEGMQMDAVNITGDMDQKGRIVVESIADEAVDGVAVPEEKVVQMDEAGDDIPEEEDAQMGGVGFTGNDNEQEEAGTADHDGVEENAMLMDAAATTKDYDEDDGIVGEDVAEEVVTGIVGDDAPEELAAHMYGDDDDEPPTLTAKKGGGRRKRGRPSSKAQAVVKLSIKRKDEEEVCFICFDGGDLVICDRRGCPKAYHPSCVNRDDDFFKSKGRWNCVSTALSDVDFDDKSSWWYLFKDYWLNLKTNLSLTVEEISAAKSQKSENNTPKKRGRKRLKEAAIEDGSEGKESTRKSTKQGLSGIRDAQTSSGKKFDIQPLLLEYIKRNNLRDPRRKSHIICDSLLQSLFGKKRVGHFEMLKLLESHFPMSEVSPSTDENHGGVVDPDPSQDADGNSEASVVISSEKRRKTRKYDQRRQPNPDDYAAIDNHNIGLMYLRRNLMEELIGDVDTFDEKVIGSFEECKRLRQSIKYGFIPRLTVGEVQEKARVLQTLKVNDWIESEKMRLAHLRDQKLKLLSTPEEHARRLNEEPEIHADPAMDPDYESPEEQEQETERSSFNKSRGSFLRKDGNLVSPVKADGESAGYTSKSESPNIGVQTVKLEGSGAKTASQPSINDNGYFPPSLKIWKASEKQDDSILLTDALTGKYEKDLPPWEPPHVSSDQRYDYSSTNLGATMMHSGTQVNPMTPTQPAMGSFSGQNIVAAGNMGHLTPGMTPATAELTSDLPSQNQISSALPQMDDRLADRSESKLGENTSHGRVNSSAEAIGALGTERGPAQLNSQQLEDTRNQMSTPSAASVQPSVTAIAGSDTQSSGWAIPAQAANTSGQSQVAGNMTWGTAPQGDASMGWGMMGQSNMNMPWVASAQGASGYNMGVTMPTQPNAVPNMGWLPNPGNTSMNMIWAATQGQGTPNAAAMMGGQMQGAAMTNWGGVAAGNVNPYPGWGTQQVGNMNQNVSWSAVQGNPGQANNNMNWNAPNGNPDWNNQQRDNGGRHSGHRDSGGRPWKSRSGGDVGSRGNRAQGVCWSYVNHGHCRKADCRYAHPTNADGYSSRNDRHFDRQHSGNERGYDNNNERQFDRQPSDNERHHDRPDDRHSGRDDDRHDDRQADRSQSRELQ